MNYPKIASFILLLNFSYFIPAQEIYDTQTAGYRILEQAINQAASENKLVLVLMGANWCPWCQAFQTVINTEPLKSDLERTFILAKIDVGHFDRNTDLIDRYMGELMRKQIPFLVILSADGTILRKIPTKDCEEGRGYNMEKVHKALMDNP